MTQKELLYVEDAIGHEQNIVAILEDAINYLEDKSLVLFLKKEVKKHMMYKTKLINSLVTIWILNQVQDDRQAGGFDTSFGLLNHRIFLLFLNFFSKFLSFFVHLY